jgi:hypothetical protein
VSLGPLATLLPAGLAATSGESPLSLLDPTGGAISSLVGGGVSSFVSNVNSWIGERGVILVIGFLLVAAGLFSHPAIREQVVSAAKKAGEVAAVA